MIRLSRVGAALATQTQQVSLLTLGWAGQRLDRGQGPARLKSGQGESLSYDKRLSRFTECMSARMLYRLRPE